MKTLFVDTRKYLPYFVRFLKECLTFRKGLAFKMSSGQMVRNEAKLHHKFVNKTAVFPESCALYEWRLWRSCNFDSASDRLQTRPRLFDTVSIADWWYVMAQTRVQSDKEWKRFCANRRPFRCEMKTVFIEFDAPSTLVWIFLKTHLLFSIAYASMCRRIQNWVCVHMNTYTKLFHALLKAMRAFWDSDQYYIKASYVAESISK